MDLAHEWVDRSGIMHDVGRFNPCFNGSCSRIYPPPGASCRDAGVSILVLMDLAHEFARRLSCLGGRGVSILVLMDLAHEF